MSCYSLFTRQPTTNYNINFHFVLLKHLHATRKRLYSLYADKKRKDSSGSPTTVEITYENKDKFLDETIDDSIKLKVRVSRLPTTNSFTYVGHSVDVLTGGAYTPAIIRKFTVPNMTKQAYETLGKEEQYRDKWFLAYR